MTTAIDTKIPAGAIATLLDANGRYVGQAVAQVDYSVADFTGWIVPEWYGWRARHTFDVTITEAGPEGGLMIIEISDADGGLLGTVGIAR